MPELLEDLQQRAPAVSFEARAGEEPIELHRLRLPAPPGEMPSSRHVVTTDVGAATTSDNLFNWGRTIPAHKDGHIMTWSFVDSARPLAEADEAPRVGFMELLYGLCERKYGCPMPRGNSVVDGVRRGIGLLMPSVRDLFPVDHELLYERLKEIREGGELSERYEHLLEWEFDKLTEEIAEKRAWLAENRDLKVRKLKEIDTEAEVRVQGEIDELVSKMKAIHARLVEGDGGDVVDWDWNSNKDEIEFANPMVASPDGSSGEESPNARSGGGPDGEG